MAPPSGVAVLVLNYNGAALLRRTLPSITDEAARIRGLVRIIVVDNGSTDESHDAAGDFQVEWRPMAANEWLMSYNLVVPSLTEDIVVLLNNDMVVRPYCLEGLIRPFHGRDDIFAVMPAVESDDPSEAYVARRIPFFKWGVMASRPDSSSPSGHTAWLHGGAAAVDRRKFIQLGGFDPLFGPGYGEDNDLGYRAWKRGWVNIFEPRSRVFHIGAATVGKYFSPRARSAMREKAMALFVLKNIQDSPWRREFHLWHLGRMAKSFLAADGVRIKTLFSVYSLSRAIREKRLEARETSLLGDREVVRKIEDGGAAGS